MAIGICVMYYLVLYNSAVLKGNIFIIGILFGICECTGIIIVDPILHGVQDHIAMVLAVIGVLIASTVVKFDGLDQMVVYGLFLI